MADYYKDTILEVIQSEDLPKTEQARLIKLAYMMGQKDAMEMSMSDIKEFVTTYETLISHFAPKPRQ